MSRILAIDYGKVRTGLAVSDPTQTIAQGLATVDTRRLMDYLADYLAREEVATVVVGEPRQLSGAPSENAARADAFCRQLRTRFPQVALVRYDERFTSALAHQAMLLGGLRQKARRQKALVDEISATIILQDYMEGLRQP